MFASTYKLMKVQEGNYVVINILCQEGYIFLMEKDCHKLVVDDDGRIQMKAISKVGVPAFFIGLQKNNNIRTCSVKKVTGFESNLT